MIINLEYYLDRLKLLETASCPRRDRCGNFYLTFITLSYDQVVNYYCPRHDCGCLPI